MHFINIFLFCQLSRSFQLLRDEIYNSEVSILLAFEPVHFEQPGYVLHEVILAKNVIHSYIKIKQNEYKLPSRFESG